MEAVKVLIIVGSKSDLPKMEECQQELESLGVASNLVVASAHRNPRKVTESIREAEESGVEVIIAGAGMAAHLPGVVAAYTDLPVIGVPLDSGLPGGSMPSSRSCRCRRGCRSPRSRWEGRRTPRF